MLRDVPNGLLSVTDLIAHQKRHRWPQKTSRVLGRFSRPSSSSFLLKDHKSSLKVTSNQRENTTKGP